MSFRTLVLAAMLLPSLASADPGSLGECEDAGEADLVALCKAKITLAESGRVQAQNYCAQIGNHDKKLYCYGFTGKQASACNQVHNPELKATCYREIGQGAPQGSGHGGTGSVSGSQRHELGSSNSRGGFGGEHPVPIPTGGANDDCAQEEGDDQALCYAKSMMSIDWCNRIGFHDKKLYCYGFVRKTPSGCVQIMDNALEAKCLMEIGCPGYPHKQCKK